MQNLISQSYKYNYVNNEKSSEDIVYEFISLGDLEINKRVTISKIGGALSDYYNLALNDYSVDEEGVETESYMSRVDNKDDEKVLLTSFVCALDFLTMEKFKDSKVIFMGNTHAKHRYYKIKVASNFNELSGICTIKGGFIDGLKLSIDQETQEKNPLNHPLYATDERIHQEDYDIKSSGKYNFIIFEVKE